MPEPLPGSEARPAAAVTDRFFSVGGGFELEYAGRFIRIWHDVCRNHDLLVDDRAATVSERKASHRCGERISQWDRGDVRSWS
jgi:hypothetical protein